MITKKLTDEEKEEIKKELENLLSSFNPDILISKDPLTVHCGTQTGNGPWKYWDELMYDFTIKIDSKEFMDSQSIYENWKPRDVAWIVAHEFFMRNNQDVNSPLAKKLWQN